MSLNKVKKKKTRRISTRADQVLKVCPVCMGVWSDISLMGERVYRYYPKGTIPTYGKKRESCKEHRGEQV